MFFKTKSGSRYQVDPINKRVRRLSAEQKSPAAHLSDGEWLSYETSLPIEEGKSACFFGINGSDCRWLQTTRVVSID